jgi:U3 small nucleolar RNA-associated protein 13
VLSFFVLFLFVFYNIDSGPCLLNEKVLNVTTSIDKDGSLRGFTSAIMLGSDQTLLCVASDHCQFLFFSLKCTEDLFYGDLIKPLELDLTKKLVGYIDVVDVKFVNDREN